MPPASPPNRPTHLQPIEGASYRTSSNLPPTPKSNLGPAPKTALYKTDSDISVIMVRSRCNAWWLSPSYTSDYVAKLQRVLQSQGYRLGHMAEVHVLPSTTQKVRNIAPNLLP